MAEIGLVKQYQNFGGQTGSEVGYSNNDSYQWVTYQATLTPADKVTLTFDHRVFSYNNQIGVLISNNEDHPGDSKTGKITTTDTNKYKTFYSGEGLGYSSSQGFVSSWKSVTGTTITFTGPFNYSTYYFHFCYVGNPKAVSDGTGQTGELVAVDIESGELTVAEKRKYTITYNGNAEDFSYVPVPTYKYYGETGTITKDIPKRPGYTFKGWNTDRKGGGTSYAPSASYTGNQSITLYAQWQVNTLTIQMHVNGGTKASDASSKMTISKNIALYDGKSQTINYGSTFNLWDYNYAPWIKLTRTPAQRGTKRL